MTGKPRRWQIVYSCNNMACHVVEICYTCGIELGLEREMCPMCKSVLEMRKKEVLFNG
jgi:hypothetical protein